MSLAQSGFPTQSGRRRKSESWISILVETSHCNYKSEHSTHPHACNLGRRIWRWPRARRRQCPPMNHVQEPWNGCAAPSGLVSFDAPGAVPPCDLSNTDFLMWTTCIKSSTLETLLFEHSHQESGALTLLPHRFLIPPVSRLPQSYVIFRQLVPCLHLFHQRLFRLHHLQKR